ncbi:MAG: hypothetical protein QMD94_01790 [Candidatus Omnitrophota bacterium]|nr:hypothetical protein [Candidatus Omnitrophota bacterium]
MKRVIFAVILAITTSIFFVSQPYAMERRPAASKSQQKKAAPTILKASGKVSGYSWSNSTITVSVSSGSPITISADKDTSIKKAGKAIKFTELKSGDTVTVTYEAKRSVNAAKSIIVEAKSVSGTTKTKKR